ncbi:MAG: M20/M25/M40 family metallo-hydrolase [Chloroflexi bacterium]|nr:M20/M25/M40 family metallo-hydrolase [Chloroflexota bacterium]
METSSLSELVSVLTGLSGPSGEEGPVLAVLAELWQREGVTLEHTAIGNLVGRAGGAGPSLLFIAHADELCYFVRAIDSGGFLWLANGQAWMRTVSVHHRFIGAPVRVLTPTGPLPGFVAAVTGHLTTFLREPSESTWNDLWVDTGLSKRELQERGVQPGTRVVWDVQTRQVGHHLTGKAFDDRAGLAIITEVLRRAPQSERHWNLSVAATIQEEIGLVGATALATQEHPKAAIILESGLAGDIPEVGELLMPARLGAGPILVHKDAMVHYHYDLTLHLEQTAVASSVPVQRAVFGGYGSDGTAFAKADVPPALVAFPTRYTHSPFETVHLRDLEATTQLLCTLLRSEPPRWLRG